MRHEERNKTGWARFAGMPLRETQASRCTLSQGHPTECDFRDRRAVLEGGAQGDRPLRVRRCADIEAQAVGASCRDFQDAYSGTGEADTERHLRQAPRAVEDGLRTVDEGGSASLHPRTFWHRHARAHGWRIPQALGLHATEADQGRIRAEAGGGEEVARRGISRDFSPGKGGKRRNPLGGRDCGGEHGRARAFLFPARRHAYDPFGVGCAAEVLDDIVREQSGQVLLDDHRRRFQRGQADRIHGEPCEGGFAQGVPRHGQLESASLQAREGMAGEEQGTNRGVLPSELQSRVEPGRTAECRLEACHHDQRSEADTGWFVEEDSRTHGHGEIIAGESENLLQGQACGLRRRINLIYCRSNSIDSEIADKMHSMGVYDYIVTPAPELLQNTYSLSVQSIGILFYGARYLWLVHVTYEVGE